jgi:hypothetical protein
MYLQLALIETGRDDGFTNDQSVNITGVTRMVTLENGAITEGPNCRLSYVLIKVTASDVLKITKVLPLSSL